MLSPTTNVLSSAADSLLPTHHSALTLWGISATIGNLEEAKDVLLASISERDKGIIVSANMRKQLVVESIFPDEIEKYPGPVI